MPNAVLLVYANCPADQEEAFNRWYDDIHLPDVLAVPGFAAAQRFRLSSWGRSRRPWARDGRFAVARYLAIYEVESDDVAGALATLREAAVKMNADGRMFRDGLQVVTNPTYLAIADRHGPRSNRRRRRYGATERSCSVSVRRGGQACVTATPAAAVMDGVAITHAACPRSRRLADNQLQW
ncbi:MAG: DUF4286 family protein [Dehalococcoidia bacterium]